MNYQYLLVKAFLTFHDVLKYFKGFTMCLHIRWLKIDFVIKMGPGLGSKKFLQHRFPNFFPVTYMQYISFYGFANMLLV